MSTLRIYRSAPFDPTSLVDLDDFFVGDGTSTAFTLIKKPGYRLASTVQAAGTFYNRDQGTLSLSGNIFTLSSPPLFGQNITAPGVNKLVLKAYDQDVIEGELYPRVKLFPFYLAPEVIDDILSFKYTASPGNPGVKVIWIDHDTGFGADISWLEHTTSDASGLPNVLLPASTAIYVPPIQGSSPIAVSNVSVSDTTIHVTDGTQFNPGDYLIIEPGTVKEEQVKCTAIVGNVLTVSPVGFAHLIGATVFQLGLKMFVQITVPVNASGGTPANLYEISPKLVGSTESRL